MTKRREPWSRRTRALFRAIERDNVIGRGTVDRIKASGPVRPRYQAGHMTAPSRTEINQIALDPCGPSTHDNALTNPRATKALLSSSFDMLSALILWNRYGGELFSEGNRAISA
jgi:hypothetical protein